VRWEAGLLEALGFGLDLSRCAATGRVDDLIYVSPKSGRAVSARRRGLSRALVRAAAFLLGSQNTRRHRCRADRHRGGLRPAGISVLERVAA
jgi:recombinational DNA repair protein (RecF pathway)